MKAGRSWLVMLVVAMASGAATAQDVPSAEAQARILDLLQQQSLYRNRVDWSRARAELAAARERAETRRLLDDVIQRSSGGHGRWLSANQLRAQSQRAQATQAAMGSASPQDDASTGTTARLGWVKVGAYMDDRTQSQDVQNQARKQAAIALQARIREQDDGKRCGWVVDLRSIAELHHQPLRQDQAHPYRSEGQTSRLRAIGRRQLQAVNGEKPHRDLRDGHRDHRCEDRQDWQAQACIGPAQRPRFPTRASTTK